MNVVLLDGMVVVPGGSWEVRDFVELTPAERALVMQGVRGAQEEHCFGALQACYMRVARLDANGSPLVGANNGYVTDALVEMTMDPEIEAGVKLIKKNACGTLCQVFQDCDQLSGLKFDMELCKLDGWLISFLVGGSRILDLAGTGLGDLIGFEFPGTDAACPNGVSVEIWQKAWDANTQATPPFAGGTTRVWFHWVFPKTTWMVGQHKFFNDFSPIMVTGHAFENPRITSNGPFDDWPADVASYGGITNLGGWFFDSATPTVACGPTTVPGAAS